jgi:hypothetical protein
VSRRLIHASPGAGEANRASDAVGAQTSLSSTLIESVEVKPMKYQQAEVSGFFGLQNIIQH